MKFLKKIALRRKLPISFLLVTSISIFITIPVSIIYLTINLKNEVTDKMRKNINASRLIIKNKIDNISFFTQQLANEGRIKTFISLDFKTEKKLNDFIKEIVAREKVYHISVYNKFANPVSIIGMANSPIVKQKLAVDLKKNDLARRGLNGSTISGIELIPAQNGINILSITSVSPIYEDKKGDKVVIGAIVVRYPLNDNHKFLDIIKENLNVDAVIYHKEKPICFTAENEIYLDPRIYYVLTKSEKEYENIDYSPNGRISEFITLFDIYNRPAGVIGIYIPSSKYVFDVVKFFIPLFLIMVICTGIAVLISIVISNGITIPLNSLLNGVNKITSGDLSHEIVTDLKDEIGILSNSFNHMRLTLNEKINTIQNMNLNLETTVKDRTKTIESLLNKMKKYLSPQLYESIIGGKQDEKLSHKRKKLTIFFSDIKDFTKTTDSMEAEELSSLLNSYLDEMAKIALKWGGTIDKFVGDAIMIFFGDPEYINDKEHALRAVKMALEMKERMIDFREEWQNKGISNPFHTRMGINTGFCTVGNFGSENRMDYTIIGSQVNIAQRLEASSKIDSILISHETYSLIEDEILCKYSGEISVKGIHYKIKCYEVLKVKSGKKSMSDYIKSTERGLVLEKLTLDNLKETELNKEDVKKILKYALKIVDDKN